MSIDITLAAKRYDGGSGSTTYTGCIPLKPGQLFEVGEADSAQSSMSLWYGASEIGIYATCLYPQHPDGSVKSLQISAVFDLSVSEERALTLKLNLSKSVAGPSAHPAINQAWMKNPKLIGCTDRVHLCSSRVALGPLVPYDHVNLPAQWQAFISTEFDSTNPTDGNGNPQFPAFGKILNLLRTYGDLGGKKGVTTQGSAVVTILGTGLYPTTAPTASLTAGMRVSAGGSYFGVIDENTFIQSVDSAAQITLTKSALGTRAIIGLNFAGGIYGPIGIAFQFASYNTIACLYYRYLTSGVLDKLADAHRLAQDPLGDSYTWNGTRAQYPNSGVQNYGNGLIKYADAYQGHAANSDFIVDEYGESPVNPSPSGLYEPTSGFHQNAYMCYVMSGWLQALGTIVSFGVRNLNVTWGGINFGDPNPDTFEDSGSPAVAGARYAWRVVREADIIYYMLSMPMKLRASAYYTTICDSPRASGAIKQKYKDYMTAKYYDKLEEWSLEFAPSGQDNSFFYSIWGFKPTYAADASGPNEAGSYPTYMSIVLLHTLLWCYMNLVEDDRMLDAIAEHATFLLASIRGPYISTAIAPSAGRQYYRLPYMVQDPSIIDAQFGLINMNPYTVQMLLALWVWAYRVTGNTQFLTVADAHASIYSHLYNGASGVGSAMKQLGETYQMAFFAAAWRAGETWGVQSEEAPPGPSTITVIIGIALEVNDALAISATGGSVAVANFVFNRAKGRVAEFYARVDAADPANCAFIIIALAATGLESDAVLKDKDTLADLLSGATNEPTNTGYVRKSVVGAALAALSPDDTNDKLNIDMPDITWTAIAAGSAWAKLVICYDPDTTGGDDSTIIPLCCYDFVIATPDGSDIVAQLDAAGFYSAT